MRHEWKRGSIKGVDMKIAVWMSLWASSFAFAASPALTTVSKNAAGKNVLADTVGKTLYVFDPDQGKPSPACKGDCAEIWPPYLLTDVEAKAISAPFGLIQRASQQPQLTFNGRPVYTYIF